MSMSELDYRFGVMAMSKGVEGLSRHKATLAMRFHGCIYLKAC